MNMRKWLKPWLRFGAIGASLLCFSLLLTAQDKSNSTDSVLAGTVFRKPGFMLPGATVEITLDPASSKNEGDKSKVKFKRTRLTCNSAGEFAIRVPGQPATYLITARAEGFDTQTLRGEIAGPNERIDVNFELEPSKK